MVKIQEEFFIWLERIIQEWMPKENEARDELIKKRKEMAKSFEEQLMVFLIKAEQELMKTKAVDDMNYHQF